jgi:hypothetical protein
MRACVLVAALVLAACGTPGAPAPAAQAPPRAGGVQGTPATPPPTAPARTLASPTARPRTRPDDEEPALFDLVLVHFDANRLREQHARVLRIGLGAGALPGPPVMTFRDIVTGARRTIHLTRLYAAHDPETGETAADPAAWLMRRAGLDAPPPEPEPINLWLKPPRRATIEFRGRRRGARVAQAEIVTLRFVGRALVAVDVDVSHDPLAPEPRRRRLGILRRERDGALYRIADGPEAEMEGDVESYLLRLARHG